MEIEQKARMPEADISTIFDCVKMQKKLAPLLRSTTPTGKRRMRILRRFSEDLRSIRSDGSKALELVGFLNVERFTKAFGVAPEKFSDAYASITFQRVSNDYSTMLPESQNTLVDIVSFAWPEFTIENQYRAKAFVNKLLSHINVLIAEQGSK